MKKKEKKREGFVFIKDSYTLNIPSQAPTTHSGAAIWSSTYQQETGARLQERSFPPGHQVKGQGPGPDLAGASGYPGGHQTVHVPPVAAHGVWTL